MTDLDRCGCGGFKYAGHRCRPSSPDPDPEPLRILRGTAVRALDRVRAEFPTDEAQVVIPLVRDHISQLEQQIRYREGPR